jgi:hypothetical protein
VVILTKRLRNFLKAECKGPYKDQKNQQIRARTISAIKDLNYIFTVLPTDQLEQMLPGEAEDVTIIEPFIQALLGFDRQKLSDKKWEEELKLAKEENRNPDLNVGRRHLPDLYYFFAKACVKYGIKRLMEDKVDPIYRPIMRHYAETLEETLSTLTIRPP